MMRRSAAGLGVALVLVLMTGCTSDWVLGGSTPRPSHDTAGPDASASPTPDAGEDCGELVLDEPGDYDLGECDSVTLEGDDISLGAVSIGELVIRGDRNDVDVVGGIDAVVVDGDDNVVDVGGPIGSVTESGRGNRIH